MKIIEFKCLEDKILSSCVCESEKEWQEILNQARTKLASGLKIKGFRPGKLPINLVDKYVKSSDILTQASEIAQVKAYQLILVKYKEKIARKYRLESNKVNKISFSDFQISQVWQKLPSIELKKWKNFVSQIKPIKVLDEEIKVKVEELRLYFVEFIDKKEAASKGDFLVIDYQGQINKKDEASLMAKEFRYQLGNSTLGFDFDKNLFSCQQNDQKKFTFTIPEGYFNVKLVGKKVDFTVKVLKVQTRKLPDVETDLISKLKLDQVKSYQDLLNLIRESLKKDKENKIHLEIIKEVWPQILNNVTADIPVKYLDDESKAMKSKYLEDLKKQKQTLAESLKKKKQSEAEFDLDIRHRVKKMLIDYLVIAEISEKEKIDVKKEEVEDYYQFLAKNQNKPLPEIKKLYSEVLLFNNLLRYKIEQFIAENVLQFNNINMNDTSKDSSAKKTNLKK